MKSVEEITAVNVFNPNVRKIRCVENEHDYLGDGTVLCEYNLEKGKIARPYFELKTVNNLFCQWLPLNLAKLEKASDFLRLNAEELV